MENFQNEEAKTLDNNSSISDKKYNKYFSQWTFLKDKLEKAKATWDVKYKELDKKQLQQINAKLNEVVNKLNSIAKELNLGQEYLVAPFSYSPDEKATAPVLQNQVGDKEFTNMANENMQQNQKVFSNPLDETISVFSGGQSEVISADENIENIFKQNTKLNDNLNDFQPKVENSFAPINNESEIPETFVIPQTKIVQTFDQEAFERKEKEFMKWAYSRAINLDWDFLNETNQPANASLKEILIAKNLIIETHDLSYKPEELKAAAEYKEPVFETRVARPNFAYSTVQAESANTKETISEKNEMPSFSNPSFQNTFNTSEPSEPLDKINHDFEKSKDENMNMSSFEIPQTRIVQTFDQEAFERKEKEFIKWAYSRAVKIDWDFLNETNQPANTNLVQIEKDLKLFIETQDASYSQEKITESRIHNQSQEFVESPNSSPIQMPSFASNDESFDLDSELNDDYNLNNFNSSLPKENNQDTFKNSNSTTNSQMNNFVSNISSNEILNEMKDLSANVAIERKSTNNNLQNEKLDIIEKRMEKIEAMIQMLSSNTQQALVQNQPQLSQQVPPQQAVSSTNSDINNLSNQIQQIEQQILRLSQSFEKNLEEENKNQKESSLYSFLTKNYRYNNK